jgi:predicted RecA/RadA family phage recombinase
MKLKIPKQKAWEWADTRKVYWHISNSFILNAAIPNDLLKWIGLLNKPSYTPSTHLTY